MAERKTIRLALGGSFNNGHPADIPEGFSRSVWNFLFRPNYLLKRPAYIDDTLTGVVGIALWDDFANGKLRAVAFKANGTNVDAYLKAAATDDETWTLAGAGATTGKSVNTYANYRGKIYYPLAQTDYGLHADPGPIMSYQGSAQTANAIGGETLRCRTITPFVDRLFLGYNQSVVTNELGTTDAYDPTTWSDTTTTKTTITNGSSVTGRITPTATTLSKIFRPNKYTVAASTTDTNLIYRFDLRNTSPTYPMPMRGEIYYSQAWVADTVMAVGAIRVPTTAGGNGFRYRVTAIAGDFKTDASTEPTWPTTVGTTVVDDQVTWICDGVDTIGSTPTTIPTLTDEATWTPNWVRATIPPMPASAGVGVRLKFGTEASPTIELAAIDFSFRDGLTDGAVGKANKGHQLTVGRFQHPFINRQSTATATITLENDIYWTETSDPNAIDGNNFWKLSEAAGPVTAAATASGRYIVFKKNGMWVFQGSADPNNPLIKERFFSNVGCIHEAAVTVFEDRVYFMDGNRVYEYEPGGEPRDITYPAMSGAVSKASFLGIYDWLSIGVDPIGRDLYVGDTIIGGTSLVYHFDTRQWSVQATDLAEELTPGVAFMTFLPDRDALYTGIQTSAGVSTLAIHRQVLGVSELTQAIKDGVLGVTQHDVVAYVDAPIPSLSPQVEIAIDKVNAQYSTFASTQVADSFAVEVYRPDDTTTELASRTATLADSNRPAYGRASVPVRVATYSPIIRVQHTGQTGGGALCLAAVEAEIRVIGGQRNMSSTPGNV